MTHDCKYAEDIGVMKSSINTIKYIGGWILTFIIVEVVAVAGATGTFIFSWGRVTGTIEQHDKSIRELQKTCSSCKEDTNNIVDARLQTFFKDYSVKYPED